MIATLIGIIAGVASTAQASLNARIREDYRSPYTTAVLSFIVSGLILAVLVLITEGGIKLPLGRIAEYPFWIWLGGSCGTAIIILNIVCLPYLGSARNVVVICFGQVMAGLLIDHTGMFGTEVTPMSVRRAAGAVMVSIGIILVNEVVLISDSGNRKPDALREDRLTVLKYMLIALINGFICASQIAINGTLRDAAGSAGRATLISMAVGMITTLIVILVLTLLRGNNAIYDGGIKGKGLVRGFRPWMISGGAMASIVVGGNAVTAPVLGTGIVTILNLIGMMGCGLLIDSTGFLGIEKKPVTISKVAGMLLMIAGTAVISVI